MNAKENFSPEEISRDMRELALVDRVIGLEAEVARLSIEGGIKDIRILQKSRAWRAGRIILMPAVVLRHILKRG
jgi:hypothetical protein